jgi:hypothetical protein
MFSIDLGRCDPLAEDKKIRPQWLFAATSIFGLQESASGVDRSA